MLDRTFWAVFLFVAMLGAAVWLAIFEHNYHPRIYRHSEKVTILQVGESELDFNHPPGAFSIWGRVGDGTRGSGRGSVKHLKSAK